MYLLILGCNLYEVKIISKWTAKLVSASLYLGDGSIAGKSIGSLTQCHIRRSCWNGDYCPPLGKPGTCLVVLGSALCQAVQALAP